MENNYDVFSKEYVSGSQTKSDTKEIELKKKDEIEIDYKQYSTSKPRRTIIRAKLIHGKN